MEKNKEKKSGTIMLRISKEDKEKLFKIVEKTSYTSVSALIRAGIEKELNLQIYKDNMNIIVNELSDLIDIKLDGFIKSQRKLYANNVRISALNTYIMGEVMKRIMGDELYKEYVEILKSARKKANYYVSRKTDELSKEEILDFYNIGGIYRNE